MSWVEKSIKESIKTRNHYKMHDVDIFIKDTLPPNINPNLVFSTIGKLIPQHLLRGIDIVYVGKFDVFDEREVNAVYQDGAIYITNEQESDDDMIDDIIHEVAHSVEEMYRGLIYNDNMIKREFLGKRQRLYDILRAYKYNPPDHFKAEYHYKQDIDDYLYKEVGYEALWSMVAGLFPTPYSVTSLREYFAISFEDYFMKDKFSLKKICPHVYAKLEALEYWEER